MAGVDAFLKAREILLGHAEDDGNAPRRFRWPELDKFNWALDYFDRIPPRDRSALTILDEDGVEHRRSFEQLTESSNRVATFLRGLGVGRGDRVLLMLGNVVPLWEVMLAAMKLGAVVIPASTLLQPEDLRDRIERGNVRAVVAESAFAARFAGVAGADVRIAVGGAADGWTSYQEGAGASASFEPESLTRASDTLLLYFTSGTTARPKLVEHTHQSYPVGHLSTMHWIGLRPGDVHLNISSPGWAKHAWSNVFAPWNAEATSFVWNARFDPARLPSILRDHGISTFCAPPTVWRMVIQYPLGERPAELREAVSAGEPLNPEVIEQVQRAWNLTIRDGYGQTETTLQIGNLPGHAIVPGSMGRPVPGYHVELLDPLTDRPADEGEICLDLSGGRRPLGLMVGYRDDPRQTAEAMRGGFYHTGDVARRDADGSITYVGRADDVFKASDYRISPFELESVLLEHEAVAEAAVVPSPDPIRLAVPKAFVVLAKGVDPGPDVARSIFAFCRERLAPFKRIRRLEFADLPKTISGKIRRVELRDVEHGRVDESERRPSEFWEQDFPELRTPG